MSKALFGFGMAAAIAIPAATTAAGAPVSTDADTDELSWAREAISDRSLSVESLFDYALLPDAEFDLVAKEAGVSIASAPRLLERAELLSQLLDSDEGRRLVEASGMTEDFRRHFGLESDAAIEKVITQLRAELVGAVLRELHPDALSEVWLEDGAVIVVDVAAHTRYPTSARHEVDENAKSSVRLTATALARTTPIRFGERPLTEVATYELIEALEAKLRSAAPDAVAEVDVRTWRIEVRTKATASRARTAVGDFGREIGLTASDIVFVPPVVGDDATIRGGLDTGSCTSGFVAERGGVIGILTAEHCGSQSWGGQTLSFHSSADTAWGEVELRRRGTHGWSAEFYYNTNAINSVTSVKSYSSTTVGATYCKYGGASGNTCGELISKRFQPSNSPAFPSSPASRRYLRFGSDISDGGDSGGPYYSGTSALGLVSGSNSSTAWASSAASTDANFADIKTK